MTAEGERVDLLTVTQTGTRSFRFTGELDLSTVASLDPVEEIEPGGDLVLDLAGLSFVDATGLEWFTRIAGRVCGQVLLRNARPSIEKLIVRSAKRSNLENLVVTHVVPVDPDSPDELPEDLSRVLVAEHTPELLCSGLVVRLGRLLGNKYFTHVGVWEADSPSSEAVSNEVAARLHQVQMSAYEGPTLDAFRRHGPVVSSSLIEERRWPGFTNAALYDGVATVAAIPMVVKQKALGVLTVYGEKEKSVEGVLDRVSGVAEQAACALTNSVSFWKARELVRQLQEALESRAVIDQAKGVLMAREAISADEAFRTLRRVSQRSNLKVRELARKVVDEAVKGRDVSGLHWQAQAMREGDQKPTSATMTAYTTETT